jgi:antitoxin ParD1/3/4
MRTTQQMSITLSNELADTVRAKVASGEYASESEVIRDGLRALLARDRAVERWLREEVGPAYDALKADPSRVITAAQIKARLAAEHEEMSATREPAPSERRKKTRRRSSQNEKV